MKRRRQLSKRKPAELIEFMRFAIFNFRRVYENFEIQRYPMCRPAVFFAVYIPEPEEFIRRDVGSIFFLYLPFQSVVGFFAEFQSASAYVPSAIFISRIFSAFMEQKISFSVMAKINNSCSNKILSFLHRCRAAGNRTRSLRTRSARTAGILQPEVRSRMIVPYTSTSILSECPGCKPCLQPDFPVSLPSKSNVFPENIQTGVISGLFSFRCFPGAYPNGW